MSFLFLCLSIYETFIYQKVKLVLVTEVDFQRILSALPRARLLEAKLPQGVKGLRPWNHFSRKLKALHSV